MERKKKICITDSSQKQIFGICAKSFKELQEKGISRFKNENLFMIRMKTGQLLKNGEDFGGLDLSGEMIKFTLTKPNDLSKATETGIILLIDTKFNTNLKIVVVDHFLDKMWNHNTKFKTNLTLQTVCL